MPVCESVQFGALEYDAAAVVRFPQGLPAFEKQTEFLLIEQTETAPVVFLQSLSDPRLIFMALPARFVDPGFRLLLQAEERALLGVEAAEPEEGVDLLSLAILTARGEGEPVTANLLAPVVIGAQTRRALQVIQTESSYRVDEPLAARGAGAAGADPAPTAAPSCW